MELQVNTGPPGLITGAVAVQQEVRHLTAVQSRNANVGLQAYHRAAPRCSGPREHEVVVFDNSTAESHLARCSTVAAHRLRPAAIWQLVANSELQQKFLPLSAATLKMATHP